MAVLVDTNILLRSVQTHHPHYVLVERAFTVLRAQRETLHLTVQNFIEFWAVATRLERNENGLGMTPEAAAKELTSLKKLFLLLSDPASAFEEWEQLVIANKISGKTSHDARLVATMKLHGIQKSSPSTRTIFSAFLVSPCSILPGSELYSQPSSGHSETT